MFGELFDKMIPSSKEKGSYILIVTVAQQRLHFLIILRR